MPPDERVPFTPEQKAVWDEKLKAINYSFVLEPRDSVGEVYGAEVVGLAGTDREGETFHYRFQEGESLDHLMARIMWERSWDGYEPLEDYLARNEMP